MSKKDRTHKTKGQDKSKGHHNSQITRKELIRLLNEDLSRVRKGHGAKNMAVVRHFAINIVRTAVDKHSLKTRRKLAGWSDDYLASLLSHTGR